jgi:glycosyltransferase involved in cell wall biosynthesis
MRVLLIAPEPPAAVSGNERSATRLAEGLRSRGHDVVACAAPAALEWADEVEQGQVAPFDVVHVYHAFRAACDRGFAPPAPWGASDAVARRRPARVLTFAGSDLPGLPLAGLKRDAIAREVARADVASVAFAAQRDAVERAWPTLRGRVAVIPKGVSRPSGAHPLRLRLGLRGDERIALQVAGVRPVKGILRALDWFTAVAAAEPRARHVLRGPVLDADLARTVRARLSELPWAHWLPPIANDSMGGAYAAADVVINTSDYEGQSNAMLEAMAAGRPLVARTAPGNREWLVDGRTARLVADPAGFVEATLAALRREDAALAMAAAGREFVAREHSCEREIAALLALYSAALSASSSSRSGPMAPRGSA